MYRGIGAGDLVDRGDRLAGLAWGQGVLRHIVDLHRRSRHLVEAADAHLEALAVPTDLVEARRGRADALRQRAGADHPHGARGRVLEDVERVVDVAAE